MTVKTKKTAILTQKPATSSSNKSPRIELTTPCTVRKRTPKLRHHKATGQAYVVLNGKAIYFGRYGSPEVVEDYHRTLAEWHAAGKSSLSVYDDMTLTELVARFWVHVESYYRSPDGKPTSEQDSLRYALRPLLKLYGNTNASAFGPRSLRAVQREMVQMG